MGACSTCPSCGENHWGSCDPAGYGKCQYCGELYGDTSSLGEHEMECSFNPRLGEERRLTADVTTSDAEVRALNEELTLTRAEVVSQAAAKEAAEAEVARLKAGGFTEEEFNALCHVLPPDAVCRFRQGCQGYQVQLFGEEKVKADVARELRWAFQRVSFAYGLDGLAEAVASALVENEHLKPQC